MSGIVIRRMHKDDLDIVSELAMLANPHAEKESYRKVILDELEGNPDLSFVAVDDEKVVGYIQGSIVKDRDSMATIEDIAVGKKHQRKGIGEQLFLVVLEELRKKGTKIVVAEIHYKNAEVIPTLYKYGFRVSGCYLDFFGIGQDAIILKLVL